MRVTDLIFHVGISLSLLSRPASATLTIDEVGTGCSRDLRTDILIMRIVIDKTNQNINSIRGCYIDDNGVAQFSDCNYVIENDRFIVIEAQTSIAEGQQGTVLQGMNGCGVDVDFVNGEYEYSWRLLLRQERNVRQVGDTDLGATCRENLATHQFVVTATNVIGDHLLVVNPVYPEIVFQVYGRDFPNSVNFSPLSVCTVGQDLKLRLTMSLGTNFVYKDFITACGLRTYDMYFYTDADTAATRYSIIDDSSCPVSQNALDIGNQFTMTTAVGQGVVVLETGIFDCIQPRRRNAIATDPYYMWFHVSVDLCYGSSVCSDQCGDYCGYSRAQGRRRRRQTPDEVDEKPREYYTRLRVAVEEPDTGEERALSESLLIAVIVSAAVLIIVTIAMVLAFCIIRDRRRHVKDPYLHDRSSRASSDIVLPVKY